MVTIYSNLFTAYKQYSYSVLQRVAVLATLLLLGCCATNAACIELRECDCPKATLYERDECAKELENKLDGVLNKTLSFSLV